MLHGRSATVPALLVVAALAMLSGCQQEISGKYIAKFTNGVCWLQLVRTPDNHLTGQLQTSILSKDGKIERNSVPVTGAVNAGNVTISASMFGLQMVTLSGTFEENKLTLTGSEPNPIVLTRSDMKEYQQQVNSLDAQAQRILAAERAATAARQAAAEAASEAAQAAASRQRTAEAVENFVSRIERVVKRMRELDTQADVHLSRFPGAEDRCRAITAKMTEYLNQERRLGGNPNAGVTRSQLVVAMTQVSLAMDPLHNAAESLRLSVQTEVQPVAEGVADLEQRCRATVPLGALTTAQAEERSAACNELFPAYEAFRLKLGAVAKGLAHLEQIYTQERKAQEEVLRTGGRLE
jgi:chromosome segregation ATPase